MNVKLKFLIQTAFRDSRKNQGKLILFMSSIVLGISALVAINSFNHNIVKDIDRQAVSLMGADVVIDGNRALHPELQPSFDSLPGEKSMAVDLLSMAYFPNRGESQFVNIKGIEKGFPYYGKIKTNPFGAAEQFRDHPAALIDQGVMIQYDLEIGDSIRLGSHTFVIMGELLSAFGGNAMSSSFAPIVYINYKDIKSTQLIQPGSLVNYSYYVKTDPDFDTRIWKEKYRRRYRSEGMSIENVDDRKEDLNEAFSSLNQFLNLVALVALLLGCIGVASSVFIYIKNKIPSIAILRCLGMKGKHAFFIYLFQIISLGFFGVLTGTILGSIIQWLLPLILSDFLPFEVNIEVSWPAIFDGLVIGFAITSLFALLPLVGIRKISPLRTLRSNLMESRERWDWLKIMVYAGIIISIFIFLSRLTQSLKDGILFTIALGVAFLILYAVSKFTMWLVHRFFPRNWSFVLRQGLSNLYRPNNQTQTLLVSIGLGTAVLTTLFIIQGLLLNNVAQMDAGNQPNMILFGIERGQKENLEEITKTYDMPVIQQVPIVTMRLEGWQGKTKKEWFADTTRKARSWAINREARVTYRDTLDQYEKLLEGNLQRHQTPDSIYITLEKGYAESMAVNIGDEMLFNVQGTLIKTYIGGIREIDWTKMRTRFFIVFPNGVLEEAPQFQVLVTKSPNPATTAKYRSEVVKTFPNVSVIDLGLILNALSEILRKVSYIIQFMAGFSILTGLIVLLSSLLLSKFQRIQESVLLRTLGASKKQIFHINATEYLILGTLSAATGIFISIVASWALAKFQLELSFSIRWIPIGLVFILVIGLTVLIGLLNSREVISKPPLEVLRKEV